MAIQLDFYVEEAVREASRLQKQGLTALILDNWLGGARLVYQFPLTASCDSDCAHCPLLRLAGQDPPGEGIFRKKNLIKTLAKADAERLALFPGHQRFLNCKTWPQYLGCYSAWLARKCQTNTDFEEELALVRSFRLIFYQANFLPQRIETAGRAHIIRLSQQIIEPPRR